MAPLAAAGGPAPWTAWLGRVFSALVTVLVVVCLLGAASQVQQLLHASTPDSAPCAGATYAAPASAHTLRAVVEHYAGLCSYKVKWDVAGDVAVDPTVLNQAGVFYGAHDFAQALQFALTRPLEQSLVQMPELVGCFDTKTRTVSVLRYDAAFDANSCKVSPWELS